MIRAGKLRHRIVIQEPVETQDQTNGAVNILWQDLATVWAEIVPLSARDLIAAQAEASKVTTRISIRYNNYINSKMRIYHASKDKYYNIEGVLSDAESGFEYLTIPCSEGLKYQEGIPNAVLPVSLDPPVIDGVANIGATISASSGLWANEPVNYTYQWYLNDIAIPSGTDPDLVVQGNLGDLITVGVIATNQAGSSPEVFSDGVIII